MFAENGLAPTRPVSAKSSAKAGGLARIYRDAAPYFFGNLLIPHGLVPGSSPSLTTIKSVTYLPEGA